MSYLSRKARKAATRAELKSAALGCFTAAGVAATSIAAITKAAGVAHGTFYVHFRSKDELVAELAADFDRGLLAAWTPLLGERADSLAALLERLSEAYFRYWSERSQHIALYLERSSGTRLRPISDTPDGPAQRWLQQSLKHLAELRQIRDADVSVVRRVLAEMWLHTGLQVAADTERDREASRRTLVALTLGALEGALPGTTTLTPTQLTILLNRTEPA